MMNMRCMLQVINMELNELPNQFGINKCFSITSIDAAAKLKQVLDRNIIAYDCFRADDKPHGNHIVVILYKKGNKEILFLTYDYYRKFSRALKKKVDNKYI